MANYMIELKTTFFFKPTKSVHSLPVFLNYYDFLEMNLKNATARKCGFNVLNVATDMKIFMSMKHLH